MESRPTEPAARRRPGRIPLSPTAAVLLAISFGLCGGYLDLGSSLFKKYCLESRGVLSNCEGFPLDRPGGPRGPVGDPRAGGGRREPAPAGLVSLRAASWLFATLAIWAALLRLPLYGACSLLLAVGLGRPISDAVAARGLHSRRMRSILAASSACWLSWRPSRRAGRRSVNTARWPDCRRRPRAPATSC